MPPEDPWTDLGDGLRVRQSRVYWMNSVLLADREHTLIVDPGVLPSELDDLARRVGEAKSAACTVCFTHGDWDHVLGRPWFPGARTLAHDRLAAEVKRDAARIAREAERAAEREGERWARSFEPFSPDEAVSGLRFLKLGDLRLVLRDAFGHSASMLSIHLPDRGVLIAADMLSDIEIPMIDHDFAAYWKTLVELQPLVENGAIETLIPGHGAIARDAEAIRERLERDLCYLDALESEVSESVTQGLSLDETQQRLDTMTYLGKDAAYSMVDTHRRNVRKLYEGSAALPTAGRGAHGRKGVSPNGR